MEDKRPLSRPGLSFWLSLAWIALVLVSAATVQWWPLPRPDTMDWNHLAAGPGTLSFDAMHRYTGEGEGSPCIHVLGTDTKGRDLLSRLVYGARISLSVGLLAPLIGLVIGGSLGCVAGFYRGWLDASIVAAMDIILAFPGLVLLLAVTFYLGASMPNLIAALGFLTIPVFCRVARAKTLALSGLEFVQAARLTGAGNLTILLREIVPNVLIPVGIYALLVVAFMIMAEGALSFLGLGMPPPTPSWGGMIADGREVLEEAPHVSLIPSTMMFLTVIAFNLMGDRLRQVVEQGKRQI